MFLSNIFYSGILFVSTLLVYLSQRVATALQRNILFGLAFMVVFLPAAIRYGIGSDYFSYEVAVAGAECNTVIELKQAHHAA